MGDKTLEALKNKRIQKEVRRLKRVYKNIEEKKQEVVEGLIQRAAYMRVSLEDFEQDLDENGFTELFSQGKQEPYERQRPAATLYNSMSGNYQKIIKQLSDLLPKEETNKTEEGDDFDDFVRKRG